MSLSLQLRSESPSRPTGFTLVEMLVTVALMSVLMLAVTQIFSIASSTISGGQAISAAVRDAQAAQAVLARDFSNIAPDGPAIVINSMETPAFRNQQDYQAALDNTNPLKDDTDGDGSVNVVYAGPGTTYSPYTYNFRNHRLDCMMFFARDRFSRQTGNATTDLVGRSTSNLAAIFLHHLLLPHTNGKFLLGGTGSNATVPGNGDPNSNPNNYFANQWTLGRVAMLLRGVPQAYNSASNYHTGDMVYDTSSGTTKVYEAIAASTSASPQPVTNTAYWSQVIYYYNTGSLPSTLPPLGYGTLSQAGTTSYTLQSSRSDVAIATFDDLDNQYGRTWQAGVVYKANQVVYNTIDGLYYQYTSAAAAHLSSSSNRPPSSDWTVSTSWLNNMMIGGLTRASDRRFQANPFVTKPVTADSASQQVPIFLPACTQFIVEFAGDFTTQVPDLPTSWSSTLAYAIGDQVLYTDGKVYIAIQAGTGQNPTATGSTYWKVANVTFDSSKSYTKGSMVVYGTTNDMTDPAHSRYYIALQTTSPATAPTSTSDWASAATGVVNTMAAMNGATPDGEVDFYYDAAGRKQIRWYGMPRDTNGDGQIIGTTGDVVPLADYVGRQTFEQVLPIAASTLVGAGNNYLTSANASTTPQYTVAWGPSDTNRPKLVRITLTIDRPEASSNIPEGQTFEYVFKVGL